MFYKLSVLYESLKLIGGQLLQDTKLMKNSSWSKFINLLKKWTFFWVAADSCEAELENHNTELTKLREAVVLAVNSLLRTL